jgi:hypothetical protein
MGLRLTLLLVVTIIVIATLGVISVVVPTWVGETVGLFTPVKR